MISQVSATPTLGRYRVSRELGRGSMGVVYAAHDPQLERDVAIKTVDLPAGLTSALRSQLIATLRHEAKLSAKLTHPGIIRVFDYGEENGRPYLVLELVEGRGLDEVIREQGGMRFEEAREFIGRILDAMSFAHRQGIVHRDIKPANVMVMADGAVRLMDFGIADAIKNIQSGNGKIAGTPRYMSPEQIQGKPLDSRTDIFSLSVMFYELLCGQPPFPQKSLDTLREAIVHHNPASLHALRSTIPEVMSDFIARAMSKKPGDRFDDGAEMLKAFKAIGEMKEGNDKASSADGIRKTQALARIRRLITEKGDFPATAQFVAKVTAAARSEHSSATSIAENILKDFSLTNRILRMVNSPYYRGAGKAITTISRAVVILGTETVLSVAGGLGIFEHFYKKGQHMKELKQEAIASLLMGMHARQIAAHLKMENSEEAFISAMLHNLGRLIVAFYLPEVYKEIHNLTEKSGEGDDRAAQTILGVTYHEIAYDLATSWNMPKEIISAMQGLSGERKGKPQGLGEQMQAIVTYSRHLGLASMINDAEERTRALKSISHQFADILPIPVRALEKFIKDSVRHAWDISHALRVDLKKLGVTESIMQELREKEIAIPPGMDDDEDLTEMWSGEPSLEDIPPSIHFDDPAEDATHSRGKHAARDRDDILMRTIGEITMAMMGEFKMNDILMMVLEGMLRGVGFDNVLLALVTPQRDKIVCRFGLGSNMDQLRENFFFPLAKNGGLPALCILENREVILHHADKYRLPKYFPKPFVDHMTSNQLVMLPIEIDKKAIGLFFVARHSGQDSINRIELRNLQTLTNQATLAISHSTNGHQKAN